jgi:hypothetical protein
LKRGPCLTWAKSAANVPLAEDHRPEGNAAAREEGHAAPPRRCPRLGGGHAFRWKRKLESGEHATIAELAEREGIAPSYMTRVLRMTLLAPDIVEAILDGKQGPEVTLLRVMEPFPALWPNWAIHF